MAVIVLCSQHRIPVIRFITVCVLCSALNSCRVSESEPGKSEVISEVDSELVEFRSGIMPCEPPRFDMYVQDQSRYSLLRYVEYSTKNRLDLVPVNPNHQLIPLAIGRSWNYRAFVEGMPAYLLGQEWKQAYLLCQVIKQSGRDDRESRLSYLINLMIDYKITDLSNMIPDTLRDTMSLPLKGEYIKLTSEEPIELFVSLCDGEGPPADYFMPQDLFPEEDYYNSIYPGGTQPKEQYYKWTKFEEVKMGVRKWYLSSTYRYNDECYVFSSDPRGVIVGTVDIPRLNRKPIRGNDTVTFVTFIPNDPHPYDSCGEKTGWESPVPIATPAGVLYCYRFTYVTADTVYFARGVGAVRSVKHNVRYSRKSPDYRVPYPSPDFLELASYSVRP